MLFVARVVVVKPGIWGRRWKTTVSVVPTWPRWSWWLVPGPLHHRGLLLAEQGDGVGDDQRQQDEAAEGFQPHQSLGPG